MSRNKKPTAPPSPTSACGYPCIVVVGLAIFSWDFGAAAAINQILSLYVLLGCSVYRPYTPRGHHLRVFRRHTNVLLCFVLCSVDADLAAEEPIAETPVNSNARFRRMSWIAGTFYLIVMILWSVDWLEPQCCDLQNNYKWSFALGLRYINGPPPTWFSRHRGIL